METETETEVKEGELPPYNQIIIDIKSTLTKMPKQFRKTIYLWLSLEFGIAKWEDT